MNEYIMSAIRTKMAGDLGLTTKSAFLPLPGGQPMDPAAQGAGGDPMAGAAADPAMAAGGDPMAAAGGDPMMAAGAPESAPMPAEAPAPAPEQGAGMSEDALMAMPLGQLTVEDFMGILHGLIEAVQGSKGGRSAGTSSAGGAQAGKLDEVLQRLSALENGGPAPTPAPDAQPAPAEDPAAQKQASLRTVLARKLHAARVD